MQSRMELMLLLWSYNPFQLAVQVCISTNVSKFEEHDLSWYSSGIRDERKLPLDVRWCPCPRISISSHSLWRKVIKSIKSWYWKCFVQAGAIVILESTSSGPSQWPGLGEFISACKSAKDQWIAEASVNASGSWS